MHPTRHCDLCDYIKPSFKVGTTCGLTNRKPEFNRICPNFTLSENFENQLKSLNIEYDKINRKKSTTYIYFIFFTTVGIAVIVAGYLTGKYAYRYGVFSTIPVVIMSAGLVPLGMALEKLKNFRRTHEVAKNKKDKVDEVLNVYQIKYDIDITYGEEFHETQEVFAELKMKGMR